MLRGLSSSSFRRFASLRPASRPYLLQQQPNVLMAHMECRRAAGIALVMGSYSSFHATPKAQGAPFLPFLLGALKASTALELARTTGRIALTLVPILLLKNYKSRKILRHATLNGHIHGKVVSEEKKETLLKRIRKRTILFHILLFTPISIFWATILASLERTPLTGRWRLIILSPEEEDAISAQLAGPGWYQAVGNILANEDSPPIIPPNDWRYTWVRDTLRTLESAIPVLQIERNLEPIWLSRGPDDIPLPPPADYPLRPRPRGSEYLRWFGEMLCARTCEPAPHAIPGPPYSLLVVDKPDASNAFSYGFGPDGGGGIVVYSGFLNDILSKVSHPVDLPSTIPEETSWWFYLLGGLFNFTPPPPPHLTPTEEQTSELAILLSHELAHLILSHHLETLSSSSVIIPGVMSIVTDIVRTLLFPVTMLFGPFVNDAVAQLGKVGSGEIAKVSDYCTSTRQEIEADVVSARILAHAGFDARQAAKFWEDRGAGSKTAECTQSRAEDTIAHRIMGSNHPMNEVRVEKLKGELVRWETEKQLALKRLRAKLQKQEEEQLAAAT